MKFSELSPEQQAAIQAILAISIEVRVQEERSYTQEGFRLLVLANGAGIALLATFMGSLAGRGDPFRPLIVPMILFIIGIVVATLTYVPLFAVAANATAAVTNQVVAFVTDKMELEQIQGYGLNRRGRFVVGSLLLSSFVLFLVGVICSVSSLRTIGGAA